MYDKITEQDIVFKNQLIKELRFLRTFAKKFDAGIIEHDDLVQDTLLRAMNCVAKYRQGTNLRGWLSVLMRNIYINNYRKYCLFQKFIAIPDTEPFCPPIDAGYNHGEDRLLSADIKAAFANLRATECVPFKLFVSGYKYREIASKLQIPLGTVKTRIFLARNTLKTILIGYRHKDLPDSKKDIP